MTNKSRFLSFAMSGVAFAAVGLATTKAVAGTITVNTAAMTEVNDGKCSFLEAIHALNANRVFNECNPGSGSVTITLPPGIGNFVIPAGLPIVSITRSVTVRSAVANTKVTIQLASSSSGNFAVFDVDPVVNNTTVVFQDIVFDGANAPSISIGIYAIGAGGDTLVLDRCEIEHWQNGGVVAYGFTLNVTNSYFHDNAAGGTNGGGGIQGGDSPPALSVLNMSNTTMANNYATYGGAIFWGGDGRATIVNSSFIGNDANYGAAIGSGSTSAIFDITATTIAVNTVRTSGALKGPGIFNLTETVLAQNFVTVGGMPRPSDWNTDTTIASVKNSLIDSMTSYRDDGTSAPIVVGTFSGTNILNTGTTVIVTPPYILPDLGGPTLNNVPLSQLETGSPAINALSASGQTVDQRGYLRGIGSGSKRYDIGAFEYNSNAEAEAMVAVGTPQNGAISHVSSVPNFTPAFNTNPPVGAGIKFTPNAGLTQNASFVVRVPLILGAGTVLRVNTQKGPASGNYRVAIRRSAGAFSSIGTLSLYAPTAAQTTVELPIASTGLVLQDYDTVDVQFTLVSKTSGSSNNFFYLDSATFHR